VKGPDYSMLDWSALRVILNITREGSMVKAARLLKTSQPTLSRQLAKVEQELGVKLFERRQGKLVATDAGLAVSDQAQRIEQQLLGLEDTLRSMDNEMSGVIRISAPAQLLPYSLGDVLVEFQQTYPDITLDIKVTEEMADFASGEVDVVFRAEENPKPSLWGYRIAQLNLRFFGNEDLLAKYGDKTEEITQAKHVPLVIHNGVVVSSESETLRRFPHGRIVMRTDNLETSATFVRRGLGIARLPEIVGRNLPGVKAIESLSSQTQRSLWVLTHRDLRDVKRIRRFVEFVNVKAALDPTVPQ
jgi:DNA-binding transcriptional LysR family regulator